MRIPAATLRLSFRGRFHGEDLHRGLRAVAAALGPGDRLSDWTAGPRRGSGPCYAASFVAGDAELHEHVEIDGHVDDGRPDERGPTYRWRLELRVLTQDDFVTLRTRGGGHVVGGDALPVDVELSRPGSLDPIRAAMGAAMPDLLDDSDLASVVVHNVETKRGLTALSGARAWAPPTYTQLNHPGAGSDGMFRGQPATPH